MLQKSPLITVDRQQVLGILKATGSRDPDVLHATRNDLLSTVTFPKAVGLYIIVMGVLLSLTILGAFIGIPMIVIGWWMRRRGVRNVRTVEAAFAEYGRVAASVAVLLLGALPVMAQAPENPCAGREACTATRDFVAQVTSFRTSTVDNSTKAIAVTVRFENRTTRRLILAYLTGSGVITDDRGNRYVVYGAAAVRGIGEVSGNTFDSKFTLDPREGADARFEFVLRAGASTLLGTTHAMELAVREIMPVAGNQFTLGREHALRFERVGPVPVVADANPAPAPTPTSAPAEAAPLPEPVNNCEGKSRCYDAGPFIAEVRRVTPSTTGRHHVVELTVRFRNMSQERLILTYRAGTNGAVDELGNRYYYGRAGTHDGSVKGMGTTTRGGADARFTLRPGEQREATFTVVRFNAGNRIGSRWAWDAVVEELEVLSSTQVRSTREHSVGVNDLTAGAGGVGGLLDAAARAVKKP